MARPHSISAQICAALVCDSINFIQGYRYTDYGITTRIGSGAFNEFAYTQGIWDSTTGLYYLNARFYNPVDGRFLTQDPYRGSNDQPDTWHLYGYCAGDPINWIDPSGNRRIRNVRMNTNTVGRATRSPGGENHFIAYRRFSTEGSLTPITIALGMVGWNPATWPALIASVGAAFVDSGMIRVGWRTDLDVRARRHGRNVRVTVNANPRGIVNNNPRLLRPGNGVESHISLLGSRWINARQQRHQSIFQSRRLSTTSTWTRVWNFHQDTNRVLIIFNYNGQHQASRAEFTVRVRR